MWKCKKCEEENEDTFDSCWSCGTSQDGTQSTDTKKFRLRKENEVSRHTMDKIMANQNNGTATKNKPLGIILVAIYFAVAMGLFASITSIPLVSMSGLESSGWVALIGIALLAIGVLSFAACYGLWILIDWGRSLAIAISAIDIPLSLIALKIPGTQATTGTILLVVVGIALDAVIIWYFCKDDVKSLFSKDPVPISTDKSTDKFCTECGAKNSKDSGFCSECGAKIK